MNTSKPDFPKTIPPQPPQGAFPPSNGEDEAIDDVPMFKRKRVVIPLFLLLVALVAVGWYWYVQQYTYVSTDDAFIDANRATVSSKILGRIVRLSVDENDTVKAGDTLVRLDDVDLQAQRAKAEASIRYLTRSLEVAGVSLDRARDDFDRAKVQFTSQIITREQYNHATSALKYAEAQQDMARSQIATAQADLGVVRTQLTNTVILAPLSGVIAKRWVLSGDIVSPGQAIFSLYDVKHVWVVANYEETKLHGFHAGSRTQIFLDAMPGVVLQGKVLFIGSATAAQFSLIPPNNASGNFTKITQRVPVKISIETDPPSATLLPGLSATVRIFSR